MQLPLLQVESSSRSWFKQNILFYFGAKRQKNQISNSNMSLGEGGFKSRQIQSKKVFVLYFNNEV